MTTLAERLRATEFWESLLAEPPTIEEEVAREWGECQWTAPILFGGEIAGRWIAVYESERAGCF